MAFAFGDERPFEELAILGVAVRLIVANIQSHSGILYRHDGEAVRLLHLRAHHDIRDEAPSPAYLWDSCVLHEINARLVAGQCAKIARRRAIDQIPFGFRFSGVYFDAKGNYIRPLPEDGLTCATFILAVFGSLGLSVVDLETWPSRPEDRRWTDHMINNVFPLMNVPRSRIRAQKRLIEAAVRVRPEEAVAAASVFDGQPIQFPAIAEMARALEARLLARGQLPP